MTAIVFATVGAGKSMATEVSKAGLLVDSIVQATSFDSLGGTRICDAGGFFIKILYLERKLNVDIRPRKSMLGESVIPLVEPRIGEYPIA